MTSSNKCGVIVQSRDGGAGGGGGGGAGGGGALTGSPRPGGGSAGVGRGPVGREGERLSELTTKPRRGLHLQLVREAGVEAEVEAAQ